MTPLTPSSNVAAAAGRVLGRHGDGRRREHGADRYARAGRTGADVGRPGRQRRLTESEAEGKQNLEDVANG